MSAVLVLEDDPTSLSVLNLILERDYRVLATDRPDDALKICELNQPDLLIADNRLRSSASGVQTAFAIHQQLPSLPILIVSGTEPVAWEQRDFQYFEELVTTARIGFLCKPFTSRQLRENVSALLDAKWNANNIQALFRSAANSRVLGRPWLSPG